MFVFTQRQITMLFAVESNERFAVTSSLLAQAQRHAASEHTPITTDCLLLELIECASLSVQLSNLHVVTEPNWNWSVHKNKATEFLA